jgi:hypothetical protein
MLGVTIFGIFLTPVFYYLGRKWTTKSAKADTIKPIPSTAKNVEII